MTTKPTPADVALAREILRDCLSYTAHGYIRHYDEAAQLIAAHVVGKVADAEIAAIEKAINHINLMGFGKKVSREQFAADLRIWLKCRYVPSTNQ